MFFGRRGIPSVCLEHAINVGLAAQLDVISSLEDVNAVVLLVETTFGFNTHSSAFGLDMLADLGDEWFSSGRGLSANCKVINLAADQDIFAINSASTDVPLMDSIAESHLVDENFSVIRSQRTPASGSPWRARQRGMTSLCLFNLSPNLRRYQS